jgi:hypothetical protein
MAFATPYEAPHQVGSTLDPSPLRGSQRSVNRLGRTHWKRQRAVRDLVADWWKTLQKYRDGGDVLIREKIVESMGCKEE